MMLYLILNLFQFIPQKRVSTYRQKSPSTPQQPKQQQKDDPDNLPKPPKHSLSSKPLHPHSTQHFFLQNYPPSSTATFVTRKWRSSLANKILNQRSLMAGRILVDNIGVRNNPARFQDNLEFQITFTAVEPIPWPLEWRIIYVGSAKDEDKDQLLEEFEIGPITQASTMKFSVECSPPDYRLIPADQLICVTAIIITLSLKGQEFIRVGYYVHNVIEQLSEEERATADPSTLIAHTRRTVLTDKPRITKFRIDWGGDGVSLEKSNQPYDSNNSLLGNKMRETQQEMEEKQSTLQQKQNSHSLMKSERPRGLEEEEIL